MDRLSIEDSRKYKTKQQQNKTTTTTTTTKQNKTTIFEIICLIKTMLFPQNKLVTQNFETFKTLCINRKLQNETHLFKRIHFFTCCNRKSLWLIIKKQSEW